MNVVGLFSLLVCSVLLGACSLNSSAPPETADAGQPSKTVVVTYDSTAKDKKRELPATVPATEYAPPALKTPPPAN